MLKLLRRWSYALVLAWHCLGWLATQCIGSRTCTVLGPLRFERCYHCDERYPLPGLVYCRCCLDQLAEEYKRECLQEK